MLGKCSSLQIELEAFAQLVRRGQVSIGALGCGLQPDVHAAADVFTRKPRGMNIDGTFCGAQEMIDGSGLLRYQFPIALQNLNP